MSIVSKAATALVAYETQDYIPTKAECLARYRKDIADEWTPLLEDVFEFCKRSLHYQIPSSAVDRAKLREICARTLDFENHFLRTLDVFLGSEDHDPQEVDLVRQRIVFP